MQIEISDPQYRFLTSKQKHTGFVAGLGSGKSFIGTLKTLLKIINDGIPKVAYYLPTYGDIRDIAFDGFPLVCEALGYKYQLNKTDKEFRILFGASIIGVVMFRNMSEPESIVGYQVGYSLIDETDILPMHTMDKAFKKIIARNRLILEVEDEEILAVFRETGEEPQGTYYHPKTKKLCWINSIDVAGTPEGFKWFQKRFEENFNPKTDLLVRASTYSNLHNLPADYIDTLEQEYPKELFEAYVNGLFVNITSGTVYKYFSRAKNTNKEIVITIQNYFEPIHVGADFNIGGCANIILVQRANQFCAVDEITSYDTREMAHNLFSKYQKHLIYLYPDASSDSRKTSATRSDLQLLKDIAEEYGVSLEIIKDHSNPEIIDRVTAVNNAFEKQKLTINIEACPKLTKALEQQAWDARTNKPEKMAIHPAHDDYNDALGYAIAKIMPVHRPRSNIRTVQQVPQIRY